MTEIYIVERTEADESLTICACTNMHDAKIICDTLRLIAEMEGGDYSFYFRCISVISNTSPIHDDR